MKRISGVSRLSLVLPLSAVLSFSGCNLLLDWGFCNPPVPQGLAVSGQTESSLSVSWEASRGAKSYQLYRSSAASGPWDTASYEGADTSFTDMGLAAGTTYYYAVKASNCMGTSLLSDAASGTTTTTVAVPATPTGLAVTGEDYSHISLTWDGVAGATSYQLYRADGSSGPWTTVAYDGASTSATDSGLAPGTTYYYVVQATNSAGSSDVSAPVSDTTWAY